MGKYEKESFRLPENHTWSAKKGYNVLVLDRGAVRIEVPDQWKVLPDPDSIKIRDRDEPDDDMCLAVSYLRLAPIDWSGLPVSDLVEAATRGDERPIYEWLPIMSYKRRGVEIGWRAMRFIDPKEQREAYSHLCIARKGTVQMLLTFEFWEDDAARARTIWGDVLSSIELNDYIANPLRGPWGKDS